MTIDEMIQKKIEYGYTNEYIAELSGVPLGTVQKIFGRVTKAPRKDTVEAIERIMKRTPPEYVDQRPFVQFLQEEFPQYGSAAEKTDYTVEDYYKLPDNRRVELIDGVFYDMATPTIAHQTIQFHLGMQLQHCIDKHGSECKVMAAALDVQLFRDNRTMVQPDLFMFCSIKDARKNKYFGAPDFAVEIMSPSSRTKDQFTKLNKYKFAGVREYWIIDPKNKVVLVYDFENDKPVEKYTFRDKIPVGISNGKCIVDFAKIDDAAKDFYDLEE